MRSITIRQFQQHMYEELKDLPVVVTVKGVATFKIDVTTNVTTSDQNVTTFTPNVTTNTLKNVTTYTSPVQNRTQNVATYSPHKKCAVSFCREDATASGKLYNETTGEVELVLMCKNHAFKSLREYA